MEYMLIIFIGVNIALAAVQASFKSYRWMAVHIILAVTLFAQVMGWGR